VVKIDFYLPGCPPSADVFWKFLTDINEGREPFLPYELIHYD
jgi:NAD-reducing hydrogenase small subunit